MSMWNFRIMRHGEKPDLQLHHAIHEVYYDADGRVNGWTQEPVTLIAFEDESLETQIAQVSAALGHPILDFETGTEIEGECP